MKLKLIVTVGISNSGKTSFVEGFLRNRDNWVNLNRDDIRFHLFTAGKRDWTCYKFNRKNEKKVTDFIDRMASVASLTNKNIVVSDTNLNPNTRQKWKDFAECHGYEYEEMPFEVTWEEARKRNSQREGGITEGILWSQYLRMNEYMGRKTYEPNICLKNAVIVDVDGTIADMKGVRKPFEWDKVGSDNPRQVVISMLKGLVQEGVAPVFLSGRDGVSKEDTYDWIKYHVMGGEDFHLFMREQGDCRKDKVIKEEIFWKYVANNFNVVAAIDDRASVLQLWRELKIPNIIDVSGDRYHEF